MLARDWCFSRRRSTCGKPLRCGTSPGQLWLFAHCSGWRLAESSIQNGARRKFPITAETVDTRLYWSGNLLAASRPPASRWCGSTPSCLGASARRDIVWCCGPAADATKHLGWHRPDAPATWRGIALLIRLDTGRRPSSGPARWLGHVTARQNGAISPHRRNLRWAAKWPCTGVSASTPRRLPSGRSFRC